jgi:type I restriction enzyme R subunit
MDSVSDLLDRSVGAREYIIRSADGADPLIDLNQIDFEQLALRFAANKRTVAKTIQEDLEKRLDDAVRKNPTRLDLAERFRRLIDEYNAGTHNIEELFRRLGALNKELSEEEQRAIREGLTEAELAIFDLLTKPEPELTDADMKKVKAAAKKLLAHIEEKLVLDWKRRQQTRSAVKVTVRDILDAELPPAYGPEMFRRKVDAIFDHIYVSFGDAGDGASVYDTPGVTVDSTSALVTLPTTAEQVDDAVLAQICSDPTLRAQLLEEILGTTTTWAHTTDELLNKDESRTVEYKQTARWNAREQRRDKTMEAVVVKTVAGMLNDQGGTLLIGVTDDGTPVGLDDDYAQVKPPDADGYINWLDTLFENTLGHAGAHRLTIRIDQVDQHDVCRIDIPASSRPIWVKNKTGDDILYQRRNNSTRQVPSTEVERFIADRFVTQKAG